MAFELPFILWENEFETATSISITSEAAGFPKENLYDLMDWTYWKAEKVETQNITIDIGSKRLLDSVAFLSHNFGSGGNSIGTQITVQTSEYSGFGGPFTMAQETITSDAPFYLSLTPDPDIQGPWRYYRIWIENMNEAPYIGELFLGNKMTIPVGPEFSFDPDSQKVKAFKFLNDAGEVITSSMQFAERNMNVPFKRIPQSFVASDLLPFLENHYREMKPFFFVPDPGDAFGTGKIYFLIAPDNPKIELPIYNDDIGYRNWTLRAQGFRQSVFS